MQWNDLLGQSPTASWFQTPQAYDFYCSVAGELEPFGYAVGRAGELKGVCIGYVVHSGKSSIAGYFTSRAVIQGGPLLADDITESELAGLLSEVAGQLQRKTIYVETRNLSDYSRWRQVFEKCNFLYQPHYNYIQTAVTIDSDIDRNRRRNIEKSAQNGLKVCKMDYAELPELYSLLRGLYAKRLRLPLFGIRFFENLMKLPDAEIFVAKYQGKIVGGEICVALQGRSLYDWYGCGNNTLKDVHPSEFVTYMAICWARDNGIEKFDFMGAGTPDEPYGVRDFKARFGGRRVEYGRFLKVNAPVRYAIGKTGLKILHVFNN